MGVTQSVKVTNNFTTVLTPSPYSQGAADSLGFQIFSHACLSVSPELLLHLVTQTRWLASRAEQVLYVLGIEIDV